MIINAPINTVINIVIRNTKALTHVKVVHVVLVRQVQHFDGSSVLQSGAGRPCRQETGSSQHKAPQKKSYTGVMSEYSRYNSLMSAVMS